MPTLLYLTPGLVPPQAEDRLERYFYLSEILDGDVLLPVWFRTVPEARTSLGTRYPVCFVGRFAYHIYLNNKLPGPLRSIGRFVFFIRRGLALHRRRRYDVIAAYGTNMPGVAGAVLKFLTGAKLIVEVPGAPDKAYVVAPKVSFAARLKKRFSDLFLHISVGAADCVYLRYPAQLARYPLLRNKPGVAFPNLVPVRSMAVQVRNDPVVLAMGSPWFIKGIDTIIQAFKIIASRVPGYKLRLMGHFPDRGYLDHLARGCDQVEFIDPSAEYEVGLNAIASCAVFVLASRTEAMARVLLQAMAIGKPVVASAVDGIPFYIQDNVNGLLFPSEDIEALAAKLLAVLQNPDLAARLGQRARERMLDDFDERAFVRNFKSLVELAGVPCESTPPPVSPPHVLSNSL